MPHALITGASSGIGQAIAERLLREGWRVTGLCRGAPPAGAEHRPADLTRDFTAALAGLAPDALVHAAGIMRGAPLGALDHEAGAALWRLHVDVAARLADAMVPGMPDGGRVVFIGSRRASGAAGAGLYAASKAAMVALARSWAAELAPRGITVNVVSPGATDTPMLRDPARGGAAPKLPPIGRLVRPGEVAALVGFLLGDEAGAITGQEILVCGGASL